jgi:hypothetical protein
MRCEACDQRISFKAKFCGNCGAAAVERDTNKTVAEAREYAKEVLAEGRTIAKEATEAGKRGLKTETGKSVAACAAIGAVVAVPIPFVGPILGAAVGAGIGFVRKVI